MCIYIYIYISLVFPEKFIPKRNSLATIDVEIPSNATGVVYCVGGTAAGRNVTFQRWAAFLGMGGFQKLLSFFQGRNIRQVKRWFSKKSPTGPTEWTPKPEYPIALATSLQVRWQGPHSIFDGDSDLPQERVIEIQSIWLLEPYYLDISPSHTQFSSGRFLRWA